MCVFLCVFSIRSIHIGVITGCVGYASLTFSQKGVKVLRKKMDIDYMFSAIIILICTVYSSEEIDRVKVALLRNMETKNDLTG